MLQAFSTSAIAGGDSSASRSGRFTPENEARHPLVGRMGGPHSQMRQRSEQKNLWHCQISNSDYRVIVPIVSLLHGLSYPSKVYCIQHKYGQWARYSKDKCEFVLSTTWKCCFTKQKPRKYVHVSDKNHASSAFSQERVLGTH
jgi:hypothetical protein